MPTLLLLFVCLGASEREEWSAGLVPPPTAGLPPGAAASAPAWGHGSDSGWFARTSVRASYVTLGPDINAAFGQIEGLFAGEPVDVRVVSFAPSFSMTAATPVKRMSTNVLPTFDLVVGRAFGRHQVQAEVSFLGVVPLTTISASTPMTMSEAPCANLDDCPMAKLGFVDRTTGRGSYALDVAMKEDTWLTEAALGYGYELAEGGWGRLAAGASLGVAIISLRQQLGFRAVRTDAGADPYDRRTMTSTVVSTATNDVGPLARVFVTYDGDLTRSVGWFAQAGGSFGWVDLHRHIDGGGTIEMGGDVLPISFPATAISVGGKPFEGAERDRMELRGFFAQVGLRL